jgi:tRNA-dihydrouridine synthase A
MSDLSFPISIAPMMEWTDRHYRFLMRLITKKTILYTEMVTAEAILHGNLEKLLYREKDNPIILQLGGDSPEKIFKASQIGMSYGYDGLNLNVGCPSQRVQSGSFGACLMKDPNLVAELMLAMKEGGQCPISIKHRIGVNGQESYKDLANFVKIVSEKGDCNHFIVHARIAILEGLSPSENRTIPPLRYEDVFQLKKDFPHLNFEINGGILNLIDAMRFLEQGLDGVMIGRAAYENPMVFQKADQLVDSFKDTVPKSNEGTDDSLDSKIRQNTILKEPMNWEDFNFKLESYLQNWLEKGGKVHSVLRHSLGFFHGKIGGKKFRRYLSENMHRSPNDPSLFRKAMQASGVIENENLILKI